MKRKIKADALKLPAVDADIKLVNALDEAFKGFNFTTPTYYKKSGLEVFDVLRAFLGEERFKGFLEGNAIKYILRLDGKDTRISNLTKASHYIAKLLELENEVQK